MHSIHTGHCDHTALSFGLYFRLYVEFKILKLQIVFMSPSIITSVL